MYDKKFTLVEDNNLNMALQYFRYELDNKNNVIINWTWPVNRMVKLMLVFEWGHDTKEIPKIEELLQNNHPHEIVFRDLKSDYITHISRGRHKFLICPGYFEDDNSVIIYKPSYLTDWLYRRTPLVAKAIYKPLPLGQFQRVNLKVATTEITTDGNLPDIIANALSYSIWDNNKQLVGKYPLDMNVINGDYYFYIKKDQTVTFTLDKTYMHILTLN